MKPLFAFKKQYKVNKKLTQGFERHVSTVNTNVRWHIYLVSNVVAGPPSQTSRTDAFANCSYSLENFYFASDVIELRRDS